MIKIEFKKKTCDEEQNLNFLSVRKTSHQQGDVINCNPNVIALHIFIFIQQMYF